MRLLPGSLSEPQLSRRVHGHLLHGAAAVGGLGRHVGRGRLVIPRAVVVVEVVLAVSAVSVVPLQLSFECVILLAKILLSVVVGVAASVTPLERLVGGDIDVLEVSVSGSVVAVGAGAGNGKRAGPVWPGEGEGRHRGHQAGAHQSAGGLHGGSAANSPC